MEELSDIVNLLSGVSEIHEGFSVCSEHDFNVFSLCGVDHYELWHSKIIAHFLSPQGAHGFKGEFLRAFAHCFGLGEYSDCAIVRTEVSARSGEMNFGRFDILIEDEDTRNICIVENKVFAGEGEGQLSKYKSWLDGRRASGWNTHLVFLTLNGQSAQSLSNGYTSVAYFLADDCKCTLFVWLNNCAAIAKEVPCVRETLFQYRNHIKEIATGGDAMDAEIVSQLKNSMCTAEKVFKNYSAACLSFANRILVEDVKARLDKMYETGWQCESGLSFARRESGVLYRPSAMPSDKDLAGQIYVIFAETGLVQCQIGLWQDIKGNNRIVDDGLFNSAISKIGLKKDDGWNICKSQVGGESWSAWCPIFTRMKEKCPYGIDWNGEFFDKYSREGEFKRELIEEIVAKVTKLYKLQMLISGKQNCGPHDLEVCE